MSSPNLQPAAGWTPPSVELVPITAGRVYSSGGVVHIQDIVTADPDLLALVENSADPEAVVQHALSTGARALAVAQTSLDTRMVEESFAQLVIGLKGQIDGAGTIVSAATDDLLNHPTRGVGAILQSWRTKVEALMDSTFNPDRATSAFGRLDQILDAAGQTQLAATRVLLNPDAADSPMARVLATVQTQIGTVLQAVSLLSDKVAAESASRTAVTAAMERSAVKGEDYEQKVVQVVTGIAAGRGDVAEGTGRTTGSTGGLVGDIIVAVDPATIRVARGIYVLECKDRKLSVRAILDELHEAAANRDAQAAIAVFSLPEHCPVDDPFTIFDNRAIVLYDKNAPDASVLRLACMWARWVVQREAQAGDGQIDVDDIRALLEDGRRILGRRANVRRAHSSAAKKIQEAAEQVDEMHDGFSEVIEKIEQVLSA